MEKNEILLFEDKKDCCGCGACLNVCSKNAISMEEDSYGFKYPRINDDFCIKCGACKRVCAYQNKIKYYQPKFGYVAVNKNEKEVKKSASGGVFAAIAHAILAEGGKAYGAAYEFNNEVKVSTIGIESVEDLPKLQGSKYVQSNTENIFKDVKDTVLTGRKVLFSGTPCQIAALNSFLGREYENLLTIDIVCHGVPNQRMLNDYLETLKKPNECITALNFRDKTHGWEDYFFEYMLDSAKNKKGIHCRVSSYYENFLNGYIFRKNCYSCKYASLNRPADLTIGDYWGISKEHPELFKEAKWFERKYTGISCLLVNTKKGKQALEKYNNVLELVPSAVEKIAEGNGQLKGPTHYSEKREEILKLYKNDGYKEVEFDFQKTLTILCRIKDKLKCMIPLRWKKILKRMRNH